MPEQCIFNMYFICKAHHNLLCFRTLDSTSRLYLWAILNSKITNTKYDSVKTWHKIDHKNTLFYRMRAKTRIRGYLL